MKPNPAIEKLARELYAVAVKADAKWTGRAADKYAPFDDGLGKVGRCVYLALARHVIRLQAKAYAAGERGLPI